MADAVQVIDPEQDVEPSPSPSPAPASPSATPPPISLAAEPPQFQKDLQSTDLTQAPPEAQLPPQQPQDETPPEAKAQEPTGKAPPEGINDIASSNDREGIMRMWEQGQIDRDTAREAAKAQVSKNDGVVQDISDAAINAIKQSGQAVGAFASTAWDTLKNWSPSNPLFQFGSHIGNAMNEIRILGGPDMMNQPVASDLRDRMNAAKTAELQNMPPEAGQDAQDAINQKYASQSGLIDQIQHLEQQNGYGLNVKDKAGELARVTAIDALDPNYLATRKQQAINNLVSGGVLTGVEAGKASLNLTKYTAAGPLLALAQHYADSKKTDDQWNDELDMRKRVSDAVKSIQTGQETVSAPLQRALTEAAGFAENPFSQGNQPGVTVQHSLPYLSPQELTAKGEAPSPEKISDISQLEQLVGLSAIPELGLGEAVEGATKALLKGGEGTAKTIAAGLGAATKSTADVVKKFGPLEAIQSIPELIKSVGTGAGIGGAVHGGPGAVFGGIAGGTHYLMGKYVAPLATYAGAKTVQKLMEFTGNAFAKAAADSYSGKGFLSNLAGWGLRQGTQGAIGIAPFAAAQAQTPEEFGSNLALGSLMHMGARAPGDIWSGTAGPYFDSLFRSTPTKGVQTQPPIAYGTIPAADQLTAKLADQLPEDQKQKFTAVQNLMGRDNETHLVPPQLYGDYYRLFNPTGELPNSNGFWISGDENKVFPGKSMSFIRSDRVPEALIHEGMGHPIYQSLPDDLKTVINRASLDPMNQDINQWTNSYFQKFGDPRLKDINYDSLPTAEQVNSGDPVAQAKSAAALGYTKDDIMAERGAELLSKVIDGVPIDKLTSEPGNARNLKYAIGKMFEFWGIPTVTPQSQSILGVNPSLSGALALEDYMRNYAKGKAAQKPPSPEQGKGAPTQTPPSTSPNPETVNRQFDAIASGVAGTGKVQQTPVSNIGTPNVQPQPEKQQAPIEPTKEETPPAGEVTTELETPSVPPTEIPQGEIPETRKPGALTQDERGVVYNRILRREGASDEQGGQTEAYGFRSGENEQAYRAIMAARAKFGQGSPQELAVAHQQLEAEAVAAGIDHFTDPGLQSVVASMAHMRGPGGAQAILNAAVDGKIEVSANLKPETIEALNNMSPEEAQAKIRQAREEYDRRVYGHDKTTRGGVTSNWWDTYSHGLLSRYDAEASEGLAMSKGDPDAYRDQLDTHRTFAGPTASASEPQTTKIPRSLVGQPITAPEEIVNAKRAIKAQSPTDDELARLAASGNKTAEEILRDNYGANWLSKVSQDVRNEYGNAYPQESTRQNVGLIGQADIGNRTLNEQAKVLQAIQEQGGLPSANAVARSRTYLEPNAEDLRDLHEQFSRLTPQEKQYLKDNYGVTPQKLFKGNAPTSDQVNSNLTRQGVSNFGTSNELFNHIYDTLSNMRQVMAGRPVLRQEGSPNVPQNIPKNIPEGRQPATEADLRQAANGATVPTTTKTGKDRTGTQAYQQDLAQAQMEAMLERHAAGLDPEDTQVRMYRDPDTGRVSAVGDHIDMSDPMNRILTEGVPRADIDTANEWSRRIGQMTDVTHFGAARGEGESTLRSVRESEQELSPAAKRLSGEAPAESHTKTIIPTRIEVAGLHAGQRRVVLRGVSPDKVAQNVSHIQEALPKGDKLKGLSKEEVADHLRDYLENHRHGYSGDGSKLLIPEEQADPTYSPKMVPKDAADLLNAAMADTGARSRTAKAQRAREMAAAHGYLNPETSEVNPLREKLGEAAENLTSPHEEVLAQNVLSFHGARKGPAGAYPERIREAGDVLGRHLAQGLPNPQFVKAGFMPETSRENFLERAKLEDARKRPGLATTNVSQHQESPENSVDRPGTLERYSSAIRESAPSASFDRGPNATARVLDEISFQEKQLLRHAIREGTLLKPNPRDADASGGEHLVWLNNDGTVTKETHGYKYGYTPYESGDVNAPIQMRYATPSEYLNRLSLARGHFGDQTKVDGLVQMPSGELRLRTRQPRIGEAEAPSDPQVHDYMDSRGFEPDPKIPGSWRHPDGTIVLDAENRNFALDRDGKVTPIDLMMRGVGPKTVFMPETSKRIENILNIEGHKPSTYSSILPTLANHYSILQEQSRRLKEQIVDKKLRDWSDEQLDRYEKIANAMDEVAEKAEAYRDKVERWHASRE